MNCQLSNKVREKLREDNLIDSCDLGEGVYIHIEISCVILLVSTQPNGII